MSVYFVLSAILAATLILLLAPVYRNTKAGKPFTCFAVAVCAVFIMGAFGLYYFVGAPAILPLLETRNVKIVQLKEDMAKHADEIKANPKNLEAWVKLGEEFMETSQFTAAANAFKRAVVLSQGNPAVILAYSEALINEADGQVTDDAKKSLQMVILQQPENPTARYWLIVRQLQDGNAQEAMPAMKKLYHSLPDDSPLKARIDEQIGRK